MVASVVPDVTGAFRELAERELDFEPVIVGPGTKTGVPIRTDNPREVGADRVVNTLAAFTRFGGPSVVVDFGTSTNFDVVSAAGEFLGGVIAPGLQISAASLVARTARLTRVDLVAPRSPIGTSTVEAIQSGLIYGTAAEVDGVVDRIRAELEAPSATVIATGGLAPVVIPHCRTIDHHEPWLTLEGLRLVHERARRDGRWLIRMEAPARPTRRRGAAKPRSSRLAGKACAGSAKRGWSRSRSACARRWASIAPVPTSEILAELAGAAPDVVREERRAVAGRVVRKRDIGNLKFVVVRDQDGDLQLVCDAAAMDERLFGLLDEVDLGDVIAAEGRIGATRRGEPSVFVERWAMLTKSIRPLPEKWHGLKDPDLQQRRRELHLATDPEARRPAIARAAVLRTIRGELDDRGFIEVETPVLQDVAGGALARPFTTHHEALDVDLKLRISLELYLKRVLVGGLERIYEIGRNFRNEGIDREHNPEFTMLELYQAYADYDDIMALTRDLVIACARRLHEGTARIEFRGVVLDLDEEWDRVTVLGSVAQAVGEKITLARTDLRELAAHHDVEVEPSAGPGKIVAELFDRLVQPTILRPTFVCDFPREVSPLARAHRDDPGLTEHFDLVIGGVELATGFSELTDPDDQRARFLDQLALREAGDDEAHPLDEGFLRALEHGMPPTGGVGIGIDRLLMLLIDAAGLRDLILFPQHRPE